MKETPKQKIAYSVDEMAAVLGISRPVAYDLANRADFPAVRISPRRIVVPIDALAAWLNQQAEKEPPRVQQHPERQGGKYRLNPCKTASMISELEEKSK